MMGVADAPRYPCAITVHCDLCPTAVRADYLVRDSDGKETRRDIARTYLRTQGWRCGDTGDYCPDHKDFTAPQPSTEDTTMTDQLRAELLRLINERGVVDLDAEDLANDVTQLFQPDNPGCWAEDETTATTRCLVKFVENNQWEGETWTHWLQVNGNEDELTKLSNLLAELELEADEDAEDPPYELVDFEQQTLSEEHVDVLVEHAGGDGYAAAHTKVVGKFVCPDSLGEGGRAIYKGDITKHFTLEAA